jgi:hypothetical protein
MAWGQEELLEHVCSGRGDLRVHAAASQSHISRPEGNRYRRLHGPNPLFTLLPRFLPICLNPAAILPSLFHAPQWQSSPLSFRDDESFSET